MVEPSGSDAWHKARLRSINGICLVARYPSDIVNRICLSIKNGAIVISRHLDIPCIVRHQLNRCQRTIRTVKTNVLIWYKKILFKIMLIAKFQSQFNGIFVMLGNLDILAGGVKMFTYFNRYGQWRR
ncbi:MAG: hypothetical protein QME06_08470 [Desulfobacterales bacterium]|nr:hypothetical protein [Desulfobacterales bacterium]